MGNLLSLVNLVRTAPIIGLVLAVAIAAAGAAGFGAGWQINGWRLAGDLARMAGQNTVLTSANQRCGVDVAEVKKAVQGIVDEGQRRAAAAAAAMKATEGAVKDHLARAEDALKRPPVPPEKQCDTVKEEQREYIRARRNPP